MPTVNVNMESQIASEITRAALQTLISTNAVERKQYYITNAVNNTRRMAVFFRSANQTTFGAMDVATGQYGRYFIVQDLFIPIAEAQGAVLTYINLASFPGAGTINTVYIAQDTGTGYTWNGSAYVGLSGGTVFAANFAALPVTGAANTLYITTDNGNSYLWDGTQYVETSSNEPLDFIPRQGTQAGFPVTGPIQWNNINNYSESSFGGVHEYISDSFSAMMQSRNGGGLTEKAAFFLTAYTSSGDNPQARMSVSNATTSRSMDLIMRANDDFIEASGGVSYFQGLKYSADYRSNFQLLSLIDLFTLKSRLWNGASDPTVSDDGSLGFVAGRSLYLNTATGVLWKCEDASTGAAVWVIYYDPTKEKEVVLSGSSVTTTSSSLVDITGLTIALPANTSWLIESRLGIGCNNTGGVRFGYSAPGDSSGNMYVEGVATSMAIYQQSLSTNGALSATAVQRFNGSSRANVTGRIDMGATAGNFTLQFASGTSGQLSTIGSGTGSYLKLIRIL
jgi:hypothetical protein